MPQINARQVEAFRAVMLTGGMTSASELIGTTQPAVSRLVKDFEVSLGLALFERRGNQIAPTADAVSLFAEVERSFVGLGRIADLAGAIRQQTAGLLRVAAMPAIATGALPRIAARFVRRRLQLRMSVQGMPSHMIVEAVAAGQADFGIAVGPLERAGFPVEIIPCPAVAIVPECHQLAGRSVIAAADFAGERFISVAVGSLFHSRVAAALTGIERVSRVETPLSEIACGLVAEGVGVSVIDPFAACEFEGRGVAVRLFVPLIDVGVVLIKAPARPLSPLAATFIAACKADLAAIVAGVLAAAER